MEYLKPSPQGLVSAYSKVLFFYRITLHKVYPYPRVYQLVMSETTQHLQMEYGGVTLDPIVPGLICIMRLDEITHRIHLADHRTDALLKTGVRANGTRS